MYLFNFWMASLGVAFLYGIQLLAIWTTVSYFGKLDGWSLNEIFVLYGSWLLSYGIMILFFAGIRDFTHIIRRGEFEIMLIRPHYLIWQVMCGRLDLVAWSHVLFGSLVLHFGLESLDMKWTLVNLFNFFHIIMGGILIQGGMLIFWAALSFWLKDTTDLVNLGFILNSNFLIYPLSLFNNFTQYLFTVFPLSFISFYPVSALLNKKIGVFNDGNLGMYSAEIGFVFFILMYILWINGIKKYQKHGI